jgi:subtilisin-like proprotein convertase family protein
MLTFANAGVAGALIIAAAFWNGDVSAAIIDFSNSSAIAIPEGAPVSTSGVAAPFPSTMNVIGISNVVDVDVTLLGLSHSFSADLEIVLEGPGGQRVKLMDDDGGGNDWTNDDVTFSDGAPAMIGSSPGTSGTFSPSGNLVQCGFTQCIGAGNLLSVFNGLDPNGIWNLYINDDGASDIGTVANGWRLTFDASAPVPEPATVRLDATAQLPEPATLALLGVSLGGLGFSRRRKLH